MCTLTIIPKLHQKNGFVLTSNRDEAVGRETFPPEIHFSKSKKMLYPKDAVGGGTWIGVSETQRVVCLLNGAFEPHKRKASYKKSRGLVVVDFLAAEDLKNYIADYDFEGIEPFTAVVVDYTRDLSIIEFVWDERRKFLKQLPLEPHIWSSSPLYSEEMKTEREGWFGQFLKNKTLTAKDIWEFHHMAGTGDKNKDLVIDRGFLKTKSITQIDKSSKKLEMLYEDLERQEITRNKFN